MKKNLSIIIPICALIFVAALYISNIGSWLLEPESEAALPLILPDYEKKEISVKQINIICTEDVEIDTRLLRSQLKKMVSFDSNVSGYELTLTLEFAAHYSDEPYSVWCAKETIKGNPHWLRIRCELYNRYTIDYEQLLTKTNEALLEVASME